MRLLSARGIVPAFVAAAAAVALAAPGSALAAKENPLCATGVNVEGQGSSAQKLLQQNFWTKQFNEPVGGKLACNLIHQPTVKYNSTGSGAGLHSWGIEEKEAKEVNFGPTNAYVGTDEPPSAAQIALFEAEETTPTAKSLLTIPVAQVALAVVMHLPTGCTATSTASPGRIVLSQKSLEGIFSGSVKTWGALTDGGSKIEGAGCAESAILPVVRKDQSGTTHIFKRFLNLINTAELETASGKHTWGDLSEGALSTTWPTAAGTKTAAKSGGGELVKLVAETAGTIGYAAVSDARANAKFGTEGGAGKPTFWAELENENKKGKAKFNDPSTNGESGTLAGSNCAKTLYSDGASPFPPPHAYQPWNEVTTKTSEKTYALCGFTFDLAVTSYGLLPGASSGEADTVKAYQQYVNDKKGGQVILGGADYLALPKAVLAIAKEGVAEIGH